MDILYINTDWSTNEYRAKNNKYGGVGYYRVHKPAEHLRELGHDVDIYGADFVEKKEALETDDQLEAYKELLSGYDVIITKTVDNPIAGQLLVRSCRELDIPYIVDLDDNPFEVREDQPAFEDGYKPGQAKRGVVGALLSFASGVFTSTKPLKDYIKNQLRGAYDQNKLVYVLPNCNDIDDWADLESNKPEDKTVIGWHGSVTHDTDLAMVSSALNRVLTEYDDVEIEFVGGLTMDTVKHFDNWTQAARDSMSGTGGTEAWDKFPQLLMSRKWDIGIAPLVDDEFNRGKSHIKWMEYAMKEVPCIASAVYPYSTAVRGTDVIRDRETGMLVGEDDWEDALRDLIENESFREKLGAKANDYILQNWQYEHHIDKWERAIEEVIENYDGYDE